MATIPSQLNPITVTPGVQPVTDRTALSTPHYTFSDKIRFWRGIPQKIGGWLAFMFEYGATITGVARTLYSAVIANVATTVIGTNTNLYALYGQQLTNISPLATTPIAISTSISTNFGTLGANPVHTQSGTGNIIVTDTDASKYQINDFYTLSGAVAVNGIANTALNAVHVIRAIGTNSVSFIVAGTATGTGNGGGASVVRSTGLLNLAAIAHGQVNGQRVKIAGAVATGGITALQINLEYIIRNAEADTFDVMTAGTATSLVTGGGGTATTYQPQIEDGQTNQSLGVGYGLGLYGAGLYGTSKSSDSGISYPRIWFADRFGDRILLTPGNQGAVYIWDGSLGTAPAPLANAPTAVNYLFVSNNILVTFGYQNVANQIFSSDSGNATIWTASSTNQVFQDVVQGAAQLISHVPVLGVNLIFTPNQTYVFSYIGLPLIWSIQLLDNSVGIIAPMARCSVNNIAYWMGANNFYRWSGANVEQIPSNTQDQCTALKYVFGNINQGQISKCFAWYNDAFNEVWFHYPSASSNECDRLVRLSINDSVWSIDTMDRTCAEYPQTLFNNPRLISSENILYTHEIGTDDNTNPLPFTLTSNLRSAGKTTGLVGGFVPDSIQNGDISVNLIAKQWPQSTDLTFNKTFIVSDDGPRENIQIGGRFWQYTWSGAELGQDWVMGSWSELPQGSSPN
jgi:hypothetical protein